MSDAEQHVLLLEQPSALSAKRENSPVVGRRDASPKREERDTLPKRETSPSVSGDVDWGAPEFSAPLSQPVCVRLPALYETWTPWALYIITQPSNRPFPLLGRYYDLLPLRNKAYQLGVPLVPALREQWPTYRQLQSGLNCIDTATLKRISDACDAEERHRRLQQEQQRQQTLQSTDLLCYEDFSSIE